MSGRSDVKTGIFVLLGAAVVVVGALWLSRATWGEDTRVYTARFDRIGQIRTGNAVSIRGVQVGTVEGVSLSQDGVELALRIRSSVELPPDPLVVLQPTSLFGEWQATIVPADTRAGVDPDTLDLPPDRLPGVVLSDFSRISQSAEEISRNMASITDRLEVAFSEGTAEDLAQSIRNFNRASEELVSMLSLQREELGEFTTDLAGAAESLRGAVGDLNTAIARLSAATSEGELEEIFDNTREATASLNELAGSLRTRSQDVERSLARADTVLADLQALVGSVRRGEGSLGRLASDEALYENTAATLAELRALLDDLKANPRKYFNLSIF